MKKWTTALALACLLAASAPAMAQDAAALAQQGEALHQKGDFAGALKVLTQSAEQGNTYAMNQLGYMHLNGEGVAKDYFKAFSWFKKAADGGRAMDKHIVGLMYLSGIGVEKNEDIGKNWIRQAATDGYHPAIEWRAQNDGYTKTAEDWFTEGMNHHLIGKYAEAMTAFTKASDLGDDMAKIMIGNMYISAQGVEQDVASAYSWFKKAADRGAAEGQYFVGLMTFMGVGVTKNETVGRQWIAKAAAQGQANALEWQAKNGK